jgi:uncharacterized repeat protein (TIGR01451 family)
MHPVLGINRIKSLVTVWYFPCLSAFRVAPEKAEFFTHSPREIGRRPDCWIEPHTRPPSNEHGRRTLMTAPNRMKTKRTTDVLGKQIYRAMGLALLLICTETTNAQNANDVVVSLKAYKVVRATDGKEVLQAADRAMPGEVIQYDALYRNQGRTGVRNLQPTLPIPAGLEYLPDSAKPAPSKASVDGKNFAPIPLMRQVALPDGKTKEEPVPTSTYRALRWELGDLDSGRNAVVSARARLAVK